MLEDEPKSSRLKYYTSLVAHCSLSLIHSNSSKPYLEYREQENLFCECFQAENLARACVAVDAVKDSQGVGLKTFIDDTAVQKIAEFDKKDFSGIFDDLKIACEIARMRNARLDFSIKKYNLSKIYYHYVVRYDGEIRIFECPMHHISIDSIKYATRNKSSIEFTDGLHKYRYNLPKSTLYMEFDLSNPIEILPVKIMENPTEEIFRLYESKFGSLDIGDEDDELIEFEITDYLPENPFLQDYVTLPLFSLKKVDGKTIRYVPEKSGLNQWNAAGRPRDPREIYIPVPSKVHKDHPGFFPPRTETFDLEIPGGKIMNAKLCQAGDKGLMSNPNKALGNWLLGCIFEQPERTLLTYKRMEEIRVNAVRVSKLKDGRYYINFCYLPED